MSHYHFVRIVQNSLNGKVKETLIVTSHPFQFLVLIASELQDYLGFPAIGIWRTVSAEIRGREETQKVVTLIGGMID